MKYLLSSGEKFMASIAAKGELTTILVATPLRRQQLQRLWQAQNIVNGQLQLQRLSRLRLYTIAGWFEKQSADSSVRLSQAAQELLFRACLPQIDTLPDTWKSMQSLPRLLRQAYAIQVFRDDWRDECHPSLATLIDVYWHKLKALAQTDAEQQLLFTLEKISHRHLENVYFEFFPPGTTRRQQMIRCLSAAGATLLLNDPCDRYPPHPNEDTGEWLARLQDVLEMPSLSAPQTVWQFARDMGETIAAVEAQRRQNQMRIVMADSNNYRPLFSEIASANNVSLNPNRNTLADSPVFAFASLLLKMLANPEAMELWRAYVSGRFPIAGMAEEDFGLCFWLFEQYGRQLASPSLAGLLDVSAAPAPEQSWHARHLTPASKQRLTGLRTRLFAFYQRLKELQKKGPDPQACLSFLAEEIGAIAQLPYPGLAQLYGQAGSVVSSCAAFIKAIEIAELSSVDLLPILQAWFSQQTVAYSAARSMALFALEDVANLTAHEPLWLCGLSAGAVPATETSNNPFIVGQLSEAVQQMQALEQKALLHQLFARATRFSCARIVRGQTTQVSLLASTANIIDKGELPLPQKAKSAQPIACHDVLATVKNAVLSASSVNAFLQCPLKFYWQQQPGLEEIDETTPHLQAKNIGQLIHSFLELLFSHPQIRELAGQHLTKEASLAHFQRIAGQILRQIRENPRYQHYFDSAFSQATLTGWLNGIGSDGASPGRLLRGLQLHLETLTEFGPWPHMETEVNLRLHDQGFDWKGKIDRIDRHADAAYRIWDYKTSKQSNHTTREFELFDLQREIYHMLLSKNSEIAAKEVEVRYVFFNDKQKADTDVFADLSGKLRALFKEKNFKIEKKEQLTQAWLRLSDPLAIVLARLEGRSLEAPPELSEALVQSGGFARAESQIRTFIDAYPQVSATFLQALAKRIINGPYPGIAGSHCHTCHFNLHCYVYHQQASFV
jgi:RecB family exonuclease